jgi:hypothetical protein
MSAEKTDAEAGLVHEPLESQVEKMLVGGSSYIDDVMALYETSEQNYRAAMTAGTSVNGFSDSTNY